MKNLLAFGLLLLTPVGVVGQNSGVSVDLLPEAVRVEIETKDVRDLSRVLDELSGIILDEVEFFYAPDVSSSRVGAFERAAARNGVRAATVSLDRSLPGGTVVLGFSCTLGCTLGESRQTSGRKLFLSLAQVATEVTIEVAPELRSGLVWEFQRMLASAGFERVILKSLSPNRA